MRGVFAAGLAFSIFFCPLLISAIGMAGRRIRYAAGYQMSKWCRATVARRRQSQASPSGLVDGIHRPTAACGIMSSGPMASAYGTAGPLSNI